MIETKDPTGEELKIAGNVQIDYDGRTPIGAPLKGVIACLSGLAQGRKDDLHRLILSLSGRYTRELNLDKNTHLITEAAEGAKFALAISSNPRNIHIVTPSWLIATSESGQRAREADHRIWSPMSCSEGNKYDTAKSSDNFLKSKIDNALCETVVTKVDRDCPSGLNSSRSFVFQNLHFYLIGFDGNPKLRKKISKLIRRGNGMIDWDVNDDVSILILCDACDDALLKAAMAITSHHPSFPTMVSPVWVTESCKHGMLLSVIDYPPIRGESMKPATTIELSLQ